ncbi:MAG: LysM peptidoglycan-binding domain-containing protein [Sphingobacteriales bacterium]|nr:MAG: LysM peptidoglycan-binding domain-containing protein [Sphingobacteriales bacterium]
MTKKNKIVFITTALTFLSSLFLNNLYASDFLVDTAKNMIDTTGVQLSEMYQNGQLGALANILPFQDQYMIWDTTTVHPYHFDAAKMADTVTLFLADHGDCAFMAPVAGYVTSNFGPRTRTRYHYGIDLKLDVGDTVVSAFDGIVRIAQWSSSYGNVVVVRHYNGLETVYGHLSKLEVTPGDVVRAGQLVALGGNTGHSTGPHLHFEVRYMGQPINPNDVIAFNDSLGHDLKSDVLEVSSSTFSYISKFKAEGGYRKPANVKYYTIRNGDTLSHIAVKNNTTINRLCQLNSVSRNSKLRPGQKLKVK